MKKLTLLTLSIFTTIILAFSSVAFAAETISAKVESKAGETATVDFVLDQTLVSADYTITYDSSKLEYVAESVTPANGKDEKAGKIDGSFYGNASYSKISAKFKVNGSVAVGTEIPVTLSVKNASGKSSLDAVDDFTKVVTVKVITDEEIPSTTPSTSTSPSGSTTTPPAGSTTSPAGEDNGDVPSSTPSNDDDSASESPASTKVADDEFDQTGASIAAVVAVALIATIGSAVIINKRK